MYIYINIQACIHPDVALSITEAHMKVQAKMTELAFN